MERPDKSATAEWHRHFAVECNNTAWDLAAQPRTPQGDSAMLHAAHAAAFHWAKIGQPINTARAELLLAHVHALLGNGAMALGYARSCLKFFESNPCEAWDLAFAHLELSHAASAAGENELHRLHHARARQLGEALEDAEERGIFAEEFARIPAP